MSSLQDIESKCPKCGYVFIEPRLEALLRERETIKELAQKEVQAPAIDNQNYSASQLKELLDQESTNLYAAKQRIAQLEAANARLGALFNETCDKVVEILEDQFSRIAKGE